MAHESVNLETLRARVAALGCELLKDESGDDKCWYVLDVTTRRLKSVCSSLDDTEYWVENREAERDVGADALRRAADRCREVAAQAEAIAAGGTVGDTIAAGADARDELPVVTVLAGDLIDALYGVHGIAQVLDRGVADDDPETLGLLASGLLELSQSLYDAMGSCPWPVKDALDGIAKVHQ